jgi:hypothetical protein
MSSQDIQNLPKMRDNRDGGKTIIHKCAQIKIQIILTHIVNEYRNCVINCLVDKGVD